MKEKIRFLKKKKGFFNFKERWEEDWKGMPEFVNEDMQPFQKIVVNFEKREDVKAFAKLLERTNITDKTNSIWFPIKRNCISVGVYLDKAEFDERRKKIIEKEGK